MHVVDFARLVLERTTLLELAPPVCQLAVPVTTQFARDIQRAEECAPRAPCSRGSWCSVRSVHRRRGRGRSERPGVNTISTLTVESCHLFHRYIKDFGLQRRYVLFVTIQTHMRLSWTEIKKEDIGAL